MVILHVGYIVQIWAVYFAATMASGSRPSTSESRRTTDEEGEVRFLSWRVYICHFIINHVAGARRRLARPFTTWQIVFPLVVYESTSYR